jgi:hypothetical protein
MALYFQIRLLTGEIARRSLYQPADAIKRAPGIYQEFIEKNYALRVTLLLRLARIAQRKFLPQGLGRVQPPPSDLAARFLTTEDAFFLQSPLQNNQFWIIDKQHSNRNADNGGRPCELRSIPHKVIRPTISPWMEEANHLATVGISSCNVGSLEPIAVDAKFSGSTSPPCCRAIT